MLSRHCLFPTKFRHTRTDEAIDEDQYLTLNRVSDELIGHQNCCNNDPMLTAERERFKR